MTDIYAIKILRLTDAERLNTEGLADVTQSELNYICDAIRLGADTYSLCFTTDTVHKMKLFFTLKQFRDNYFLAFSKKITPEAI